LCGVFVFDFSFQMESENDFTPPVAPPPPAPYLLTGFEDEATDYLTSESLQRVTLVKKPTVEKKERAMDNLSALELAVKKRAAKKVDPELLEKAKEAARRVDEIRFEKTLLAQAQAVQEAKMVEQLLEEQGGPDLLRQTNFPSFDVSCCDKLLKLDLAVHNCIIAAKKVVQDRRAEEAEGMLVQLHGSQANIDQLVKGNVERYQLRLRIEAQQEAKV
jgi:hypothetical protein